MLSPAQIGRLVLLAAVAPPARSQDPPKPPPRITQPSQCMTNLSYEDFVRPYRQLPSTADADPVELALTAFEGDDRPVEPNAVRFMGPCYASSTWAVRLSAAGRLSGFQADSFGVRGGGPGSPMPAETFQQVQRLLDELPADGSRLPPPGHKLVVQVFRFGTATVRVYDRAALPDVVLTLLRLTQARIQVLTPTITPSKIWPPDEARSLGLPQRAKRSRWRGAVSPDGSIRADHDFVGHTLTIYAAESDRELHVIHEFWQAGQADGEGYMTYTRFSPDGRYLLVRWGQRTGCVLYDTQTWKPVDDPRLFPQGLIDYLPSDDWRMGLALTAAGESLIFDQANHRTLARLDGLSDVQSIAFSGDGSQMAAYTASPDNTRVHLTLWNTRTGRLTRELWPVEWATRPSGPPIWWNRDRWLLAPYQSPYGVGGMGLWDTATGHFEGTLAPAAPCNTNGVLPVPHESLLQQCYAPKGAESDVLEWTVDNVTAQLQSFSQPQP